MQVLNRKIKVSSEKSQLPAMLLLAPTRIGLKSWGGSAHHREATCTPGLKTTRNRSGNLYARYKHHVLSEKARGLSAQNRRGHTLTEKTHETGQATCTRDIKNTF